MAFLKYVNETITYPYNTKADYPYTGFPHGRDYPEFNIFWVHPTSPNPPENNLLTEEAPVFNDELNQGDPMYPTPPNPSEDNSWTEGTPVFNTELNRWEQTWVYTPLPPIPDWAGFNLAMVPPSSQSSFEVWLDQFKIPYQTPLTTAAGMGNLQETQQIYNSLKAIASDPNNTLVPPTQEYITEWQAIADTYHIGVIF